MNEKKLKEIIHMGNDNRCNTCYQDGYEDGRKDGRKEGFQKGKLEKKKEELKLLIKINGLWFDDEEKGMINTIQKRIKQLSKEIGEEKEK